MAEATLFELEKRCAWLRANLYSEQAMYATEQEKAHWLCEEMSHTRQWALGQTANLPATERAAVWEKMVAACDGFLAEIRRMAVQDNTYSLNEMSELRRLCAEPCDALPPFPRFMKTTALLPLLALLSTPLFAAATPDLSADDKQFFAGKVLPLLKQRCYECHSHESNKIKGGLAIDSHEGLLKGGDSGPAFIPGNLDKSLLITAIRYHDDDLEMPPKTKLPDTEIATLEEWIKRGAPDPRLPVKGQSGQDEIWKKAATHWAFQPVAHPAVPTPANAAAVKTPVDAFILQKLEKAGLKLSPPADKLTLIRRATYDLLGLPHTPAEVNAFIADKSPDAYEKLVDRLLASPHYGERWGRTWLDVARYADTTGDAQIQGRDNRYVFAWTYRDYVVNAFNTDKPYDQFLREQIAADLLPTKDDPKTLAALGFITVGKRFTTQIDDRIDDRIDVVCRGLLGLTVTCARCHDHKFDPITQLDYYGLHGIFASSDEPVEGPVIAPATNPAESADFETKLKALHQEVADFEAEKWNMVLSADWQKLGEFLMALHDFANHRDNLTLTITLRQRSLSPLIGSRWNNYLKNPAQADPILAPWIAFAALKDEEFKAQAPAVLEKLKAEAKSPLAKEILDGPAPQNLGEVAARYSKLFTEVDKAYQAKREEAVKAAGHQAVEVGPLDDRLEPARKLVWGSEAVASTEKLIFVTEVGMKTDRERQKILTKINDLEATNPGAPVRAMVLEDKPKPQDSYVYLRGDKQKRGPLAPREFLQVLAGPKQKHFREGSGRLELAEAIADKKNPLTARVMVNRIWFNHFEQALVGTTSDFGFRGDAPTHPELLDYLASTFMDQGWSVKKIQRLIMLSATYQQRSTDNPTGEAKDPGNELLWRMPLHRLDFESMRDTILALSGSLDPTVGGRPFDITSTTPRRTLYASVDRLNLPGVFSTFDFALPDFSSPRRYETTVPTQALFLMNSPFIIEEAKKLAARTEPKGTSTPAPAASTSESAPATPAPQTAESSQRVSRLYRLIYQRPPASGEVKDALAFLDQQKGASDVAAESAPAWRYGISPLDPKTHKVGFSQMSKFVNERWVAGEAGSLAVVLHARGGKTGTRTAAIRRWVCPAAGTYEIEGSVGVRPSSGETSNGIRARILLDSARPRQAELMACEVKSDDKPAQVESVALQAGDTLDFVAEPLGATGEKFFWSPIIKRADMTTPEDSERKHQWVAEADFAGPGPAKLKGLTPWEKYTQVLLLTNELLYVR